MENVNAERGAVRCIAWLDDVRRRQENYEQSMSFLDWSPDMLSDMGHLCLVDVPRLVAAVEENRNSKADKRNPDSNPRANGIGLPEESSAKPILLVQAGNGPTNLFVRLVAKFIGASIHVVGSLPADKT